MHASCSTSVGTLEFRCVTEPIRNYSKDIKFYQAFCDSIGKNGDSELIVCNKN